MQNAHFLREFMLEKPEYCCDNILQLKMTTQEMHICGPSAFIEGAVNVEGNKLLPINLFLRVHFF